MSTKYSSSFYFVKFVIMPDKSDDYLVIWLDGFVDYIKASPSDYSPFYIFDAFCSPEKFSPDGYFLEALNKLLKKRGIPSFFGKKEIEYYKSLRKQFDLFARSEKK